MVYPHDYGDYPILVSINAGLPGAKSYISYYTTQAAVCQHYTEAYNSQIASLTESILSSATYELLEQHYRDRDAVLEG